MSLVLAMPWFVLVAGAAISAVYHGVVYARVCRAGRILPTARDGLLAPAPAEGWPRVCVVIPAHNEEAVIAGLARSLLAQDYANLSIVFALDRCSDATLERLTRVLADPAGTPDPRADIVLVNECPAGWAGKTHAAWSGVQRGRGAKEADVLLFADADTEFDPALVRAAVGLMRLRGLGMLSLLSRLSGEGWWERVVQPAAGFELVRQHPLDVVNRADRPRAFANGQFMMFTRTLYDRIGGHEQVKGELLEDIALARHLDRVKRTIPSRWGVFMAGEPALLRCRMYRSYEAFRRGWKRIYTEASLRRPSQLREWAWRTRLVGTIAPLASAACVVAGPIIALVAGDAPLGLALCAMGGIGHMAAMLALDRVYRDQGVAARWALLYPVGAWIVGGLLLEAADDLRQGRATQWGGRAYKREAQA